MESRDSWNPSKIGWATFIRKLYARHKPDGGALILRVIIGLVFLLHGWSKVTAIAGTIKFFGMLGLTPFMAYFVGYMEVVGGILLILGFLVKPTVVALAVDMSVVVWGLASQGHGFFWGHELEFVLLVCLLAVYVMGPGRYSLAYAWLSRKGRANSPQI